MRHRRMLAPINSVKHYVQLENAVIADGARTTRVLVDAVASGTLPTSTDEVHEGAIIKAVFIEMWFKGNATAGTEDKFQLVLEKIPAGGSGVTFTTMNNLSAYNNKKNILFVSQGVTGDLTTQSIPIIRNWFKIPKGKQRFGLGDLLAVSISSTGATANHCGFATYKEYN